jgi:hypothetical protein
MKILAALALGAMVALTGCHPNERQAEQLVREELGNPTQVTFRGIQTKPGNHAVVCGEVDANDHPGAGFRPFIAYIALKRALVMPPGEVSSDDEMGNPLLKGAANRFLHECEN